MKKISIYHHPLPLLLIPLLISPLKWYNRIVKTEVGFEAASGIYVMLHQFGNIVVIYLLCLLVQYLAIQTKKYYCAILSTSLLILVFVLFPVRIYGLRLYTQNVLYYYLIGFYLAQIALFFNIASNIKLLKKYRISEKESQT